MIFTYHFCNRPLSIFEQIDKFNVNVYFQLTDDEKFYSKQELSLEQTSNFALENALDFIASATEINGANLIYNEYGHPLFADFFFFITGFHGFHVFSGVIILIVIFVNVLRNTYERRGHYEMIEKVGLYWHFVDLVWVFVFTFFYLV